MDTQKRDRTTLNDQPVIQHPLSRTGALIRNDGQSSTASRRDPDASSASSKGQHQQKANSDFSNDDLDYADDSTADQSAGNNNNSASRRRERRAKRAPRNRREAPRVDHAATPVFHQTPIILERRVPAATDATRTMSIQPQQPQVLLVESPDVTPNYSIVSLPPSDRPSVPVPAQPSAPSGAAQPEQARRPAAPTPDILASAILKHVQATTNINITSPQQQPAPSSTTHLIDESWNCIIPTKQLAETPGCFIIGIIGRSHRVVSTLIHYFVKNTPPPAGAKPIRGVSFHITPERMIILGAQQIHTSAKVQESSKDFQIAQFLFSVCHVLVVVGDSLIDTEMWDFVKRVEVIMSRGRAKSSNTSNGSGASNGTDPAFDETEFRPEVVFIARRGQFPEDYWTACDRLNAIFGRDSRFRIQGSNLNMTKFVNNSTNTRIHPNIFFLPDSNPRSSFLVPPSATSTEFTPTFHEFLDGTFSIPATTPVLIHALRSLVFDVPRYMSNGSGMLQKWYLVCEKDWGKSSQRVWVNIIAASSASADVRQSSVSVEGPGTVSSNSGGNSRGRDNENNNSSDRRRDFGDSSSSGNRQRQNRRNRDG
ncbi:hypothetical protein SmJEL517_g04143 [Synchytrium microbalum]|uniref:Uncharacterized protein n=1 Tax=Synchytrium microbalum TaxID=1806994 RepID=A0A507C1A6_9FUNG|nr:uncharacterized protein SmJEL517_g04143 [Synchytrium microbalum]TPX32839.1 hypothetical protein SmJEL517_g04143 [Synchytrium microbalum]